MIKMPNLKIPTKKSINKFIKNLRIKNICKYLKKQMKQFGNIKNVQEQYLRAEGVFGQMGNELKKSIIKMADVRQGASADQLRKIEKMDSSKLEQMYRRNSVIFEVYFEYDRLETDKFGNYMTSKKKKRDLDNLIKNYERFTGKKL